MKHNLINQETSLNEQEMRQTNAKMYETTNKLRND